MNLDHIAIAVRDIETAADRLCALTGYARATDRVTNTRQQVNVVFLRKPGSVDLKLIEPSSPESPLWPFVRKGGGLHHICFKADDVETACRRLIESGARLLTPPEPGEAFDEGLIAFLYLGLGLNVEVIDTDRRRGLIEKVE